MFKRFFQKSLNKIETAFFSSDQTPIKVFVRHCYHSEASFHKKRLKNFSKEDCFKNLLATISFDKNIDFTFLLDTFFEAKQAHFLKLQDKYQVIEIKEGTESGSFLAMLNHITSLTLDPETIVYCLEDDYIHKHGWEIILREGFFVPGVDYVTLYDHRDKYFYPQYKDLLSQIYHTQSCHWRTIPSTTNTFAVKFQTLKKHIEIHKEFSIGRKITDDHGKFCKLRESGCKVISSIPGWSTHAEPEFTSPCQDWEEILFLSLKNFEN